MDKAKTSGKERLFEAAEVVKCIEALRRESQGATEEAAAFQLALLLDMRNLLARLAEDFEASLVA